MKNPFGNTEFEAMSALYSLVDRDTVIASHCDRLEAVIRSALAGTFTDVDVTDFNRHYVDANAHAFPTVAEFLARCYDLQGLLTVVLRIASSFHFFAKERPIT